MALFLLDVFGTASIGVFMRATDKFIVVPNQLPESTINKLERWFGITLIKTNVGGSALLGSLICANSHGIVLPHIVRDEEVAAFKTLRDVNITIMENSK
ncbi:MAG: hypothetical protein QXS05_02280, partial [Candidatus Bathyarchaeia archaeon]